MPISTNVPKKFPDCRLLERIKFWNISIFVIAFASFYGDMIMKKIITCFFCIATIILFFSFSYAEEPFIRLGEIKLSLRMPKPEAVYSLWSEFELKKVPHEWEVKYSDCWFINEKITNRVIGQVCFRNEKLAWASHKLKIFSDKDDAFSLGSLLFYLLAKLRENGERLTMIKASTNRGIDIMINEIEFIFFKRRIRLILIDGQSQNTIHINETIQD